MKLHPTRLQLEEYLSGETGFLKALGIRWHLGHCKACRALRQEIEALAGCPCHFYLMHPRSWFALSRALWGDDTKARG